MHSAAVKLYPAANKNGCGNRTYAYAAHCTEVHEGNCQADSDQCTVEAVFDDAEFNLADKGNNQHDALPGCNENFGTDTEKNAEGEDDGAQNAVKPLPEQGVRCYPTQQAHRKIYAVAEGKQCYQLA